MSSIFGGDPPDDPMEWLLRISASLGSLVALGIKNGHFTEAEFDTQYEEGRQILEKLMREYIAKSQRFN